MLLVFPAQSISFACPLRHQALRGLRGAQGTLWYLSTLVHSLGVLLPS